MSIRLRPLIMFTGVILLAACGGSKSKGRNTAVPEKYFVLGNPMVMLEGTERDKTSFLTEANLPDFADYTLAGFTVFVPKVEVSTIDTITSQEELEDQNSTEDSTITAELALYSFQTEGDKAIYKAEGAQFKDYPVLEFVKVNGLWDLTGVGGDPVLSEHYSVSADKRVFSILVSDSDQLGNYLGALTFTRVDGPQSPVPKRENEYQYLAGKGIAIGWGAPVKVSVCGDLSETDQAIFQKSVTDWSVATGDAPGTLGSLTYELDYVKVSKPFSDVNQHCINLIKNYRLEQQEDTAVFGVTLPVVDFQKFTLVDSHIFIFHDALNRYKEGYLLTATHELGHLWGLGHEFSRNIRGETLHPSIMGYSNVNKVTSWDVEAIKALYPK